MTDTRPLFIAPREMLERKPKHGKPCNSCGLCCVASLCELGAHVFQRERLPGPCPALKRDEFVGSYSCDVARNPQTYAPPSTTVEIGELRAAALLLIGADTGCDARFNGEPSDLVGNVACRARFSVAQFSTSHRIVWAQRIPRQSEGGADWT